MAKRNAKQPEHAPSKRASMSILRFPDPSTNDTADTLAYMAPLSLARELHRLEYFHDVEEETLEAARARYNTQTTADLALTDLLAQPEVVTERNWIGVRSYLREVHQSLRLEAARLRDVWLVLLQIPRVLGIDLSHCADVGATCTTIQTHARELEKTAEARVRATNQIVPWMIARATLLYVFANALYAAVFAERTTLSDSRMRAIEHACMQIHVSVDQYVAYPLVVPDAHDSWYIEDDYTIARCVERCDADLDQELACVAFDRHVKGVIPNLRFFVYPMSKPPIIEDLVYKFPRDRFP